ncbi:MAG: hypothetical protein ACRD3V_25210 [Vicinamibacteria bacterium]
MLILAFAADAFASEEKKEERPIQPTPSELESFELPRPEVEIGLPVSKSPLFAFSGVGLFAASAADFTTTEWGLSRGLREGNPVASQRGIRLIHHVVGPAAVYWTTEHLQKKGKTKLALTLRIALMAAYSYAAIHNLRQVNSLSVSP